MQLSEHDEVLEDGYLGLSSKQERKYDACFYLT